MFLSESIIRAIHADRTREMERAIRDRRLIDAAAEPVSEVQPEASFRRAAGGTARGRRTGVAI